MTRQSLLLVTLLFSSCRLSATTILSESFSYANGSLVTVSSETWSTHSGTAGQVSVTSGRCFITQTNGEDVNAQLADASYSSGFLYARFTLNALNLPNGSGTYFAHFHPTTQRGRIFVATNTTPAGTYRVGIANGASSASVFCPTNLLPNSNYTVVVQYDVSSTTTKLWINPISQSDYSVTATDAPASIPSVSAFAFRESGPSPGMGGLFIDDLVIGTSFADVASAAPPEFAAQPANQYVVDGVTVSFSPTVNGTQPIRYQWRRNGVDLQSQTNLVLTLSDVTTVNAGSYSVVVMNNYGTNTSSNAVLTVETVTPYVSGGLSVLTYNVKGNGAADWSTNSSQVQAIGRQAHFLKPDIITFNEIPLTNTYQMTNFIKQYLPGYALATNSGSDGFVRSVIASRFPINRSQSWLASLPGSSLTNFGYNGQFTRDLFEAEVQVTGFPTPVHFFVTHLKATTFPEQDNANKRAAEAAAISNFFATVYLVGTNASHPYVLSGDLNEDINRPGTNSYTSGQPIQKLVSAPTGLKLTTPVNPFDNSSSNDMTVSIQASKLSARFDYILPCAFLFSNLQASQVFRTDKLIPTPSGLLSNDCKTASDHLPVLMVFTNPFVAPPLTINQGPQNQTNSAGSTAAFTVQASAPSQLFYQWIKNGTNNLSNGGNISGAASSNLVISSVAQSDAASYSVRVSTTNAEATSSPATLVVVDPPSNPVISPAGATNSVGSTVAFSVTANGTAPFSYQWQFNGVDIPGVTGGGITKVNVQTSDAGYYSVRLTNIAGAATSAPVALRVIAPFVQWNFNNTNSTTSPAPSIGSGTASLVGGTTATFASGSGSSDAGSPNTAWNTTTYAPQGTGNKSRGTQFALSTTGYDNISMTWDQRISGSASKYFRLQWSTNGTTFYDYPTAFTNSPDSQFLANSFNLSSLPIGNCSSVTLRIVSEFENTAISSTDTNYVTTGSAYTTGGTVRFDMMTIYGAAFLPSYEAAALRFGEIDFANNQFVFTVAEPAGTQVVIEASTNLVNWTALVTNTAPFSITNTISPSVPLRFYRAVLP